MALLSENHSAMAIEKAREKGYIFNVGIEAEFMLLKQDETGSYAPWDKLDTLDKPCYDLRALHRNLDTMTTLIKYMQELKWEPYANDHEDGTCQFEANWTYSEHLRQQIGTLFQVDGQNACGRTWAAGNVYAETVYQFDGQWGTLPHEPLG